MHIQFSRKKRNWALALYCFGLKRPTAHSRTRPSRALTRAQAATWAWAGKVASRPRPPRPKGGLVDLRRSFCIRRLRVRFGRYKNRRRAGARNPSSFQCLLSLSSSPLSPLSTSSLLSATATESDDGERACSGATIAPSPAPSPARVLPNG